MHHATNKEQEANKAIAKVFIYQNNCLKTMAGILHLKILNLSSKMKEWAEEL